MKTSQASPPCRQSSRYCPEQEQAPSPPRCRPQHSVPHRRVGSWTRVAVRSPWEGVTSALPLSPRPGFGYRHRSPRDFCFVFLGASQLDAIRARSCAGLCRRECKITPAETTQSRRSSHASLVFARGVFGSKNSFFSPHPAVLSQDKVQPNTSVSRRAEY